MINKQYLKIYFRAEDRDLNFEMTRNIRTSFLTYEILIDLKIEEDLTLSSALKALEF